MRKKLIQEGRTEMQGKITKKLVCVWENMHHQYYYLIWEVKNTNSNMWATVYKPKREG